MNESRNYTVKEVAELLGLSENTVRIQCRKGEIKATIKSRRDGFRISEEEVYIQMAKKESPKPTRITKIEPKEVAYEDPEIERLRKRIAKNSEKICAYRNKIELLEDMIKDYKELMYTRQDENDSMRREIDRIKNPVTRKTTRLFG